MDVFKIYETYLAFIVYSTLRCFTRSNNRLQRVLLTIFFVAFKQSVLTNPEDHEGFRLGEFCPEQSCLKRNELNIMKGLNMFKFLILCWQTLLVQ